MTLAVFPTLRIAMALLVSALPLDATIVVIEDFESMAPGELHGRTGGPGIDGNWQAQTGITEVTEAPDDFSITLPTGEVKSAGSRSLQVTGDNSSAVSARLSAPRNGTFYVAFLMQMAAGSIGTNDFVTLWFGEGTHIGAPAVGVKTQLGLNETDLMGRITGHTEAYAPDQLAVGDTYWLVARISKSGGSASYNRLEFWANPGNDESDRPDAVSVGTISFSEFTTMGVRSVYVDSDDVFYLDEIVVATEWSDLFTTVPEPSVALLFALSSTVLLRRRRQI